MNKKLLTIVAVALPLFANAQTDVFTPVKTTSLRAPSVPLITSDPYFQLWSNADQLNTVTTSHWTGDNKSLTGYVRVDGVLYQFMGTANAAFNSSRVILPATQYTPDQPYTAKVYVINTGEKYSDGNYNKVWGVPPTDAAGKNWYESDYTPTNGDQTWSDQTSPFSSDETYNGHTSYQWVKSDIMGDIYMRRSFTLSEPIAGDIYLACGRDDAPSEWYINGTLVKSASDGWNNDDRVLLTEAQKALIKTDGSENILAVHVHQNWGGAFADCGLYQATVDMSKLVLGSNQMSGSWPCVYYMPNSNDELNALDPNSDFAGLGVDESEWVSGTGPFSNSDDQFRSTYWDSSTKPIMIRRHFTLSAAEIENIKNSSLVLSCSYDENPKVYLNGELLWSQTGWNDSNYAEYTLTDTQKALLVEGDNVLAITLQQGGGGGHVDYGLKLTSSVASSSTKAVQNGLAQVMPTNTYYNFTAGPVDLNVVFTAPTTDKVIFMPYNYISYKAKSTDGANHNVQVYIVATPQFAVSDDNNVTVTSLVKNGDMSFVKTGTTTQTVANGSRQNWGYFYLGADATRNQSVGFDAYATGLSNMVATGAIPTSTEEQTFTAGGGLSFMPGLFFKDDLGTGSDMSGYTLVGYDNDSKAIINKPVSQTYSNSTVVVNQPAAKAAAPVVVTSFAQLMAQEAANYTQNMESARQIDTQIYDDAETAGGAKYAEVASLAFRQVAGAVNAVTDESGNNLIYDMGIGFWNKMQPTENAYALAPFYGAYAPEKLNELLQATFRYNTDKTVSNDGHAPHTLGDYPTVDGYETNYNVESTADLLTAAAVAVKYGSSASDKSNVDLYNTNYDLLKGWADALQTYLNDETKFQGQINIDDEGASLPLFGDNQNLKAKAIIAIAGFAQIAEATSHADDATTYANTAKQLADAWKTTNNMTDHYAQSLNVDWGQKYTLAYDKILATNLFTDVIPTEVTYYLGQLSDTSEGDSKYGLVMDGRTSNDSNIDRAFLNENYMTAALTTSLTDFQTLTNPVWNYVNETTTRVPLRIFYNSKTAEGITRSSSATFNASPLAGMLWAKVLINRTETPDGIQNVNAIVKTNSAQKVYNLNGQYVGTSTQKLQKGVYIIGNKKVVVK